MAARTRVRLLYSGGLWVAIRLAAPCARVTIEPGLLDVARKRNTSCRAGEPVDPVSFKQAGITDAWEAYAKVLTFGKGQTLALVDRRKIDRGL
jgi:hypothetical protein